MPRSVSVSRVGSGFLRTTNSALWRTVAVESNLGWCDELSKGCLVVHQSHVRRSATWALPIPPSTTL